MHIISSWFRIFSYFIIYVRQLSIYRSFYFSIISWLSAVLLIILSTFVPTNKYFIFCSYKLPINILKLFNSSTSIFSTILKQITQIIMPCLFSIASFTQPKGLQHSSSIALEYLSRMLFGL